MVVLVESFFSLPDELKENPELLLVVFPNDNPEEEPESFLSLEPPKLKELPESFLSLVELVEFPNENPPGAGELLSLLAAVLDPKLNPDPVDPLSFFSPPNDTPPAELPPKVNPPEEALESFLVVLPPNENPVEPLEVLLSLEADPNEKEEVGVLEPEPKENAI